MTAIKKIFVLHDKKLRRKTTKYVSTTAKGAALKAASKGYKDIILREVGTDVFLFFKGSRVKLDVPKKVKIGKELVVFKHKPKVVFKKSKVIA